MSEFKEMIVRPYNNLSILKINEYFFLISICKFFSKCFLLEDYVAITAEAPIKSQSSSSSIKSLLIKMIARNYYSYFRLKTRVLHVLQLN
jgi:D-alanyl-lipoteichoic acid acyltransferase DltB (MBOAT superfamily)